MKDIRYSELRFLQAIATAPGLAVSALDARQAAAYDVEQPLYRDMIATLLEDLYIQTHDYELMRCIYSIRGEMPSVQENPAAPLPERYNRFTLGMIISRHEFPVQITYRGLRRIEELRDQLKYDRVLEEMGVLLSMRYFNADLADALQRADTAPVAVMRIDMDRFKRINDTHGHKAGDEVMRAYLQSVKDAVGEWGTAYRGTGDEVAIICLGQEAQKVLEICEEIRRRVKEIELDFNGNILTGVSASIGVAISPPHRRSRELEQLADQAQYVAKDQGRDRVVVAG